MKISSDIEKLTLPGEKSILRVYADDEITPSFDLLCLDNGSELQEYLSGNEFKYFISKTLESESLTMKPKKIELITQLLFENN